MGKGKEEEPDQAFDYEAAKNAYMNEIMKIRRDAMAGTLDPSQFVYQGIKDGGRIGYQGGGSEDPMLVEDYKKYVFEMEEMGLQPMSFEEFRAQAIAGMASGGRAGYYAGGQFIPSEYTVEDARKTAMQDKLGGITEVMKQADLYRQGDVGQMYMAEGGEIDYSKDPNYKGWKKMYETNKDAAAMNENHAHYLAYYNRTKKAEGGKIGISSLLKDKDFMINLITQLKSEGKSSEEIINQIRSIVAEPMAPVTPRKEIREPFYPHKSEGIEIREPFYPDRFEGKEIREPFYPDRFEGLKPQLMADGGIMDLGGVEKDYRETGGFVPIGKEEKADDVPARLSLNEFVMTADAVRGMGDGDIDKGADRMEDLMETLEVKGKRKQGAQDMFEVSERLSAVV